MTYTKWKWTKLFAWGAVSFYMENGFPIVHMMPEWWIWLSEYSSRASTATCGNIAVTLRFVIESQCDDRERDTDRVLVSSTTTTSRSQAPNTHYISHRLNDGGYYNESIQISVLYLLFGKHFFDAGCHAATIRPRGLTGMAVYASSFQGKISYSVVSDDETCLVQFRPARHALVIDFLQCVEQAYMRFMLRY